jgi:transcription termination factor Rho
MVDMLNENEATQLILQRLGKTKTNKEFLETLHEAK